MWSKPPAHSPASWLAATASLLALTLPLAAAGAPARPTRLADMAGITHMGGYYCFSKQDYLNEGARRILSSGTRVIKVWLSPGASIRDGHYAYHSQWPDYKTITLGGLVKHPHYQRLFSMPFTSFLLTTYPYPDVNWKDGLSAAENARVVDEFEQLTRYLLTTYRGSGKTFVLQNWEGDGQLQIQQIPAAQREVAWQGMADWLNARQDGITKARNALGMHGVRVVGCAEFNWIPSAAERKQRKFEKLFGADVTYGVDTVVPRLRMDLYSFSSWGTQSLATADSLAEKLAYLKGKAPASALYGENNLVLGEYGAKENSMAEFRKDPDGTGVAAARAARRQLELAIASGVVYASYWQLYCNGLEDPKPARPAYVVTNPSKYQGVWLIRADGSQTPMWAYFNKLFRSRGNLAVYKPDGTLINNPLSDLPIEP